MTINIEFEVQKELTSTSAAQSLTMFLIIQRTWKKKLIIRNNPLNSGIYSHKIHLHKDYNKISHRDNTLWPVVDPFLLFTDQKEHFSNVPESNLPRLTPHHFPILDGGGMRQWNTGLRFEIWGLKRIQAAGQLLVQK